MLAFSNDYYGLNFRAKQSVELFCAYVYSKKSNITGEKIVADVVINNGMQESRENIEEFCRNNLMQYMRPREIRIISEQGINTSGKMSRKPSGQ